MSSSDDDADVALSEALIAGDFSEARALLRGARAEASPYRGAPEKDDEAASALELAIDLLEQGDPVAAYFTLADFGGDEHLLFPAVITAIGVACEAKGALAVARAAHEVGLMPLEAFRLDEAIPLDRSRMDDEVHAAGISHYRSCLDDRPDDITAMEGLAQRLAASGDMSAAGDAARVAIDHEPGRPAGWLVLIEALADTRQYERAHEAAEAGCGVCEHAALWTARAELFERDERPTDALAMYERALTVDEGHWPAHHGVERQLSILGDKVALAAQLARMEPYAEAADEDDRVADAREALREELGEIDPASEVPRRIEQRPGPDAAAPIRPRGMSSGGFVALLIVVALIVLAFITTR